MHNISNIYIMIFLNVILHSELRHPGGKRVRVHVNQ